MNAVLLTLLQWALGMLGQWIGAFIVAARAARADNPQLIEAIRAAVLRAEARSASLNGPQKRSLVLTEMRKWLADFGVDMRASLLNSLIELAVVQIAPAAREPGSE